MTSSIDYEVVRRADALEVSNRKRGRPTNLSRIRQRTTFAYDLSLEIQRTLIHATHLQFPSDRYQKQPVEFFLDVLGVEPWEKQIQVIESVRDHDRTACRSGHKIGKSKLAAGVALWFYCSFVDARAIMTSTTARQVEQILWREIRMTRARSGRCVRCKGEDPSGIRIPRPCPHSTLIDGEQGETARTGLKSADFREIVGFTAREAEAVAGISGRNLLYILDEGSGIDDDIYTAIEGNRAGGARVLILGNPTRNEGEFYDAFHSKARFYATFTISSEETPNVVQGRDVIPGLATRAWVEEKKQEWGEDSPLYRIRVKGEHATQEEGKIFSVHAIELAEQRWADTEAAGRLYIGLDPAGESGRSDEIMFAVRRGLKLIRFYPHRELSPEGHLVSLLRVIGSHVLPRETPVVVVDREGPIGSRVATLLGEYLASEGHAGAFELVPIRASDRAIRQPMIYDRLRDELAANLEAWFRDGGAIVEDVKLAAELHAFEWKMMINGRLKLTPKEDIRKKLGRSPDRYDALALACWEPLSLRDADVPESAEHLNEMSELAERTFDPWAAADLWNKPR